MRPYFAYGSNMDHEQMSVRCSGATPLATAVLAAHRFVINSEGVATVVSDPLLCVHGLLWSLTEYMLHRYFFHWMSDTPFGRRHVAAAIRWAAGE